MPVRNNAVAPSPSTPPTLQGRSQRGQLRSLGRLLLALARRGERLALHRAGDDDQRRAPEDHEDRVLQHHERDVENAPGARRASAQDGATHEERGAPGSVQHRQQLLTRRRNGHIPVIDRTRASWRARVR
jgi:hypothetical protein